ncbi:MAG: hypothetical protein M1816_007672 [Peltula sp. TS41687]|nr:MAG: hypothetical protein M1816_007672 [Peltula sp. TS41687]
MKFLKHIRSRSKLKSPPPEAQVYSNSLPFSRGPRSSNLAAARLPGAVLFRIFAYVCPHSQDDSYDSAEDSVLEDGCMLCDMRDLAHCALVCRRWNDVAQRMLYHSVRIDPVHYCELESTLADKRKDRFRDVPRQRLLLFMKTVRDKTHLAILVQALKMAYMTREGCTADLARTVSVLPNLRYVDLPRNFFTDDPSCNMLKQELQARCPEIRKMRYAAGSEGSFASLATRRHWTLLETLEISHLNLEPTMFLHVIGGLPTLHEMMIAHLPWLDDSIFHPVPGLPSFPPLQRLTLEDIPNLTAMGLTGYLSRPETAAIFSSLTLLNTGILPSALHLILSQAPHLTDLSITETVARSFPIEPVPPLRSSSLTTLHYEITSHPTHNNSSMQPPSPSHYNYLAYSLRSNGLPALRSLYVRDPDFPESLILAPPQPAFAQSDLPIAPPKPTGFNHQLDVYSKGLDELEWNFTHVSPPSGPGRRGSYTPQRPISMYRLMESGALTTASWGPGLSAGDRASLPPGWMLAGESSGGGVGAGAGGGARKSVIVGNGFGGFLTVPVDEEGAGAAGKRPGSSGGWSHWGSGGAGRRGSKSQEDWWGSD